VTVVPQMDRKGRVRQVEGGSALGRVPGGDRGEAHVPRGEPARQQDSGHARSLPQGPTNLLLGSLKTLIDEFLGC